jgi:hypothetical protein
MLIEEAKWFGRAISEIDVGLLSPMLNVGSSTGEFREAREPWIEEYVFQPFLRRGGAVTHLDLKEAPGVDFVGDLADDRTLRRLAEYGFKSAFCSNVLEHVTDRDTLCRAIVSLIPDSGYVFVSCPRSYPYHPDPIDTMFRPDVEDLAAGFPGTETVRGEIVECGTYSRYAFRTLPWALRTVARLSVPFYRRVGWKTEVNHMAWLFREFEASCLILTKLGDRAMKPGGASALAAAPGDSNTARRKPAHAGVTGP